MTFTPPTVSDVPLLFPISVEVPAGTTRIIDFPTEFLGVAVIFQIMTVQTQLLTELDMTL